MTYNNANTKDLTKFQEKKIRERLLLNFLKELDEITEKKKRYSKIFSEQIDILVNKFDGQGIMFYGINIELPFCQNNDNFWENVHKDIEEFINYIGSHIELVEFCYFSIEIKGRNPVWQKKEKEKKFNTEAEVKENPCIKGIIGVRSILGKNKLLIFEIKELFIMSFFDVKVQWLVNCTQILKYWNDIVKQKNFKFHRFVNYSDLYPMIYGAIADEELKFDGRSAFGQENHFISDTMNINGVQKKYPNSSELILYLIKLFMTHNNMFLYKNAIYTKVDKFKFSWEVIYTLDSLKKNFNLVLNDLKLLYPQQLGSIDLTTTNKILSNIDTFFLKLKKNNNLLSDFRIELFDNIIELKDGIFFFESEKFVLFNDIEKLTQFKTNFYNEILFNEFKSNEYWLKFFKNKLLVNK